MTLAIPDGAKGVRVERPDGSVDELARPDPAAPVSVTFARTDLLGVYTVTPIANPDAAPTPAATAAPAPPGSPPATPAASGAARRRRARRSAPPTRTRRSGSPSTCSTSTSRGSRPATRRAIPALGKQRASPGTGGAADDVAAQRPRRDLDPDRADRAPRARRSSGWSTSATRSPGCGARSRAGCAAARAAGQGA